MKYAASLARQGELVDATTADYDSFKQQLLNCPHCKSSVYLVKAHSRVAALRRLRSGKTTSVDPCEIPAFFSHHQNEERIDCELYNRTLTRASVAKSVAVARNQRLEIFRDRFVEIFLTAKSLSIFSDVDVAVARKTLARVRKQGVFFAQIPETLTSEAMSIQFSLPEILPEIAYAMEMPWRKWVRDCFEAYIFPDLWDCKIPIEHRKCDRQTQFQYALEAADFLLGPSQRRLCSDLLLIAIVEIANSSCCIDGRQILGSPAAMGQGVERQRNLAKLPQFMQASLIKDLNEPMYAETKNNKDIGVRLPIIVLMTCLLTIDWQQEFFTSK